MKLETRNIVLTGATGGIGRAIAQALDGTGSRLVLTGRSQSELDALNRALGNRHRVVVADITENVGREALLDACRDQPPDILINNAGSSVCSALTSMEPEEIEQMICLNLASPILLCRALLPLLESRPEAAIVNIGSTFGSIAYPGFSIYSASKFGLRGFTESLRRELADSTVRVLYLAPRATRTSMNSDRVVAMNEALGNAMDDAELVAAQLLSQLASGKPECFVGWPEKLFVRLNGILPQIVDSSLRRSLPVLRKYFRPANA